MQFRHAFYCFICLSFVFPVLAQKPEKYNLSVDSTVNRLAGIKRGIILPQGSVTGLK